MTKWSVLRDGIKEITVEQNLQGLMDHCKDFEFLPWVQREAKDGLQAEDI